MSIQPDFTHPLLPPPISLSVFGHGINLDATLRSGQSFSWKQRTEGRWYGWIAGLPCVVWQQGDSLRATGPGLDRQAFIHYFGLEQNLTKIWASFPNDPNLTRARAYCPGLRLLQQEPWETLCNFICSSLKQIVQIEQINQELRQAFGREIQPTWFTFPEAHDLALISELRLRECGLGFRAKHLFTAARQIHEKQISLSKIKTMPTPEARETLCQIQGVGEKVANCVLLFAYGRLDAFPIDVWVKRVLRQLYFGKNPRVTSETLREFTASHFGPNGGYAQQFLFHWIRTDKTALDEAEEKTERKTIPRDSAKVTALPAEASEPSVPKKVPRRRIRRSTRPTKLHVLKR